MEKVALKAVGINKYFHDPEPFHVLRDISISIRPGEFLTIMGKSGCGKSTLLYLLATLDTGYEGNIEINGARVTGISESSLAKFRNQHIGFVFQFHFLLPEFTALQNVMLPALKLGREDRQTIEDNAMKRLEQMNMKEHAHKLAARLSGGQQQRVAIARALINNPSIIMADEPTGNLDSANSAIVLDIFHDLSLQGNTIVTVTHDPDFAAKSDRIIEMKDGRIVDGSQVDAIHDDSHTTT
jgi:lipoprotein-releasing system ATP-binding protein